MALFAKRAKLSYEDMQELSVGFSDTFGVDGKASRSKFHRIMKDNLYDQLIENSRKQMAFFQKN